MQPISLSLGLNLASCGGASEPVLLLTPTVWSDSLDATAATGFLRTSAYAHLDFVTSATDFEVVFQSELYGTYPQYSALGVLVDGVYNQSVAATAAGENTKTFTLPAGSKFVSIVNGLTSTGGGATVLGTWLKSVSAESNLSFRLPPPTNRLVIYGDSIAVGSDATVEHRDCMATLVRAARWDDSTMVEAYGYRSLYLDASDGTARAAFVAKIESLAPEKIWMAIGTNDYGLDEWDAASFGTAYAAVLDDIHAALPDTFIYCQTPLLRDTETANGSGSTLGNYRTQIASAVSTRTGFSRLVDGTSIMTTASLADGVHPSTAGHALYGAFVLAALETAPSLSSVSATSAETTANLSATTDEAYGTLYWFVSASVTPPSIANLKAGTGAVYAANEVITSTGAKTETATGLTQSTTYYLYAMHEDVGGNQSAIATTSFATLESAFSPEDLSPVVWFDASDSATLLDSGDASADPDEDVKTWVDKSGNDYHAAQSNASFRPIRKASFKNSKDVLYFTSDWLTSLPFAGSQNCTMFVVVAMGSVTATQVILGWGSGYYNPNPGANFISSADGNLGWGQNGGDTTTLLSSKFSTGADDLGIGTWAVICVQQDGTHANNVAYLNGSQPASGSSFSGDPGTFSKTATALGIGAYSGGASFSTCHIAEVIIYNSVLSQSDREAVQTYLSDKWDI